MTSQKELEVLFYQKRVHIESHIENKKKTITKRQRGASSKFHTGGNAENVEG